MGHADKIRMQVRHVAKDGKIYINSDSFLPLSLIGNQVVLFTESYADGGCTGGYRRLAATVEAVGAIHFADADIRNGKKGIKAEQLYLELGLHGQNRRDQAKALGVRPGDSVLMDRPIQRCVGADTFSGAYLDNGLGCFVTAELARLAVEGSQGSGALDNLRMMFAVSSHEEIGRFGSRVLAASLQPDVLIAVDVNHDYEAAPNRSAQRDCELTMGEGMTMCVGAVASSQLNSIIERAAHSVGVNVQRDVRGRDTGTDAMAGVLANIDCAATSVGFPIRNMHTTSELAHTGDVLACTEALLATLHLLEKESTNFRTGHPRLDQAIPMSTSQ